MARRLRLTRSEIYHLLATAKRVMRSDLCDILLAPALQPEGRLLVVTPKRVGSAPQRNTVRRRLKALFYNNHFHQARFDCVVIIKAPGVDLSSVALDEYLKKAFTKVGYARENTPDN